MNRHIIRPKSIVLEPFLTFTKGFMIKFLFLFFENYSCKKVTSLDNSAAYSSARLIY